MRDVLKNACGLPVDTKVMQVNFRGAYVHLFPLAASSGHPRRRVTTAMIRACMTPDIPVITWTPPAENFVDWPKAVADTYTRCWFAERLAPLLSGLPKDCDQYVGGDFGRSGDLSVFIPATEQRDLRLVPSFILEIRNCPHRTQQQFLFALIDALPSFSGLSLDARGNGSALAEAARQEYGPELVREVMISEAWYRTTMPKLKAAIEDKTLALPENANILSDFRLLRVVRGVARVPDSRTTDRTGSPHTTHADVSPSSTARSTRGPKCISRASPWLWFKS